MEEFSWANHTINGLKILPEKILNQTSDTCIGHTFIACAESKIRLARALEGYPFNYTLSVPFYLDHNRSISSKDMQSIMYNKEWFIKNGFRMTYFYPPLRHNGIIKVNKVWHRKPGEASISRRVIAEYIKNNGPIMAGIPLTPRYFDDSLQVYDVRVDEEIVECGHFILLTGFRLQQAENESSRDCFQYMNSYGPEWGYAGFGLVSAALIENCDILDLTEID